MLGTPAGLNIRFPVFDETDFVDWSPLSTEAFQTSLDLMPEGKLIMSFSKVIWQYTTNANNR